MIFACRVNPTSPEIPPDGFVVNLDGKPQMTLPDSQIGLQYQGPSTLTNSRIPFPQAFGSPSEASCVDPAELLGGWQWRSAHLDRRQRVPQTPKRFYIIQVR